MLCNFQGGPKLGLFATGLVGLRLPLWTYDPEPTLGGLLSFLAVGQCRQGNRNLRMAWGAAGDCLLTRWSPQP